MGPVLSSDACLPGSARIPAEVTQTLGLPGVRLQMLKALKRFCKVVISSVHYQCCFYALRLGLEQSCTSSPSHTVKDVCPDSKARTGKGSKGWLFGRGLLRWQPPL